MQPREAGAAKARKKTLALWAALILLVVAGGALIIQRVPDNASAPLFVLIVIVEVVIAPIPGGAVGYLGAARYGFWQAWPLLWVGNVIGTAIAFLLARRIGTPIFEDNVSPKQRARFNEILQGHPLILWFFYSVPMIPVDVLSVMAGLSAIRTWRFFLIAFTGYIVYTGIIAYAGAFLADYVGVAQAMSVIGAVFLGAVAVWLWKQHKRR